jgi:hypothetical protein
MAEAPEAHRPVLRLTRPHETVYPDAAHRRSANARRDGNETVLPGGGMLEGGQPIRLGTQRDHQPTRPHRYSHFASNLKVRPPAGSRRVIRPAHEAARAVCMYDVATAAPRPRDRRAL